MATASHKASLSALVIVVLFIQCVHPVASVNHDDLHRDEVLKLSQKFQEALFASEQSQTMIYRMREVFFPSSKYRFWQADNIDIIDIEVCLEINGTASGDHCIDDEATHSHDSCTQCMVFRWTNSYFVNLIDIHLMYTFEVISSTVMFGTVAHEHKDTGRLIKIMLNVSCEETCPFIEKKTTKQALVQFLSWVKVYAHSQGKPTSWDDKDQGYVTRKYDYITVDLLLFDKKSEFSFKTTLTCFILCNVLTVYLLLKYTSSINAKLNKTASHKDYKASFAKGLVMLTAILTPSYILGTTFSLVTSTVLGFTSQCDQANNYYGCIPEHDFETVHQKQLMALLSGGICKIVVTLLYAVCSIYVIKTSRESGVVFQHSYLKWIEVYLLWSVLMGIHIVVGLASLPILIFTILTPMYMIFYLSFLTVSLVVLILPLAAIFHLIQLGGDRATGKAHLIMTAIESAFVYFLGSGIVITLLILYYIFLVGGASLNGVKGILFSLLPPATISIAVLVVKARSARQSKLRALVEEHEPLLHALA